MPIANRTLKLRQGRSDTDVAVRIFAPRLSEDSWSCRYEIDWPEGKREGAASGHDAVQALLFALMMVGAEIYTSSYHKAGNLVWSDPGQGYGFPVPQNMRDLLVGDDAKCL